MIITVGLDVSKKKLDAWASDKRFFEIANDKKNIISSFKQFKGSEKNVRVVMEATGKYHRLAHKTLTSMGFPVMVINPYQSRHFAHAMNIACKTDKVDAKVLCSYGQRMDFLETPANNDQQEILNELAHRKTQLQSELTREKNRLQGAHEFVKSSIEKNIKFLKKAIENIDKELEKQAKKDADIQKKLEILTSVPGIGTASALTLLANLPELGQLSRREIASLGGLAPMNCDSGTVAGKRSIQKGRLPVRQALYMPILSAIQNNLLIRDFNARLKANGKPGLVAATACMRKMLTILNHMLKHGTKWKYPIDLNANVEA